MSIRNCKACDHFQDVGHSLGVCRRYPTYQNRSPNERCGEFTPVPYDDAMPEMLALPVREVNAETIAKIMAEPLAAKPKRKYTRKAQE